MRIANPPIYVKLDVKNKPPVTVNPATLDVYSGDNDIDWLADPDTQKFTFVDLTFDHPPNPNPFGPAGIEPTHIRVPDKYASSQPDRYTYVVTVKDDDSGKLHSSGGGIANGSPTIRNR